MIRCGSEGCTKSAVGLVVAPSAMDAWSTCEDHAEHCVAEAQRLYQGGAFANMQAVIVLIAREVAT